MKVYLIKDENIDHLRTRLLLTRARALEKISDSHKRIEFEEFYRALNYNLDVWINEIKQ